MKESDQEIRAKLSLMWTPEMFDRFETDVRELFRQADTEFLANTTEAEREEMIAAAKRRAINLVANPSPRTP